MTAITYVIVVEDGEREACPMADYDLAVITNIGREYAAKGMIVHLWELRNNINFKLIGRITEATQV